jgi:hypothetical protein
MCVPKLFPNIEKLEGLIGSGLESLSRPKVNFEVGSSQELAQVVLVLKHFTQDLPIDPTGTCWVWWRSLLDSNHKIPFGPGTDTAVPLLDCIDIKRVTEFNLKLTYNVPTYSCNACTLAIHLTSRKCGIPKFVLSCHHILTYNELDHSLPACLRVGIN